MFTNDNSEVTINPDYFFKEDAAVMTLTKFEYFAGLAMQGLATDGHCGLTFQARAEWSVQMARALMAAFEHERKEGRDV